MHISLFIHSTTGNTETVARYTAGWLKNRGHTVITQDLVKNPSCPDLRTTDLLIPASPTMYFRPTLVMERFVAALPVLPKGEIKPAFLLGTCAGEPGDHFSALARMLEPKGWKTVGAHWVPCASNYPTHLAAVRFLQNASWLRSYLENKFKPLQPLLWTLWPNVDPDEGDREELDSALRGLCHNLMFHSILDDHFRPMERYARSRVCSFLGKTMPMDCFDKMVGIKIDEDRCDKCNICVENCPTGTLSSENPHLAPRVGSGCTGCFACYNLCPKHAISAVATPQGKGVYKGPSENMRKLFAPPS